MSLLVHSTLVVTVSVHSVSAVSELMTETAVIGDAEIACHNAGSQQFSGKEIFSSDPTWVDDSG